MRLPQARLLDIREAIGRIREYVAQGEASFRSDRKTQDAVLRNLEIIGEAVRHLPAGLLDRHPAIPWKRIAGTRDVLIHRYFLADLDLVWAIIGKELRALEAEIDIMLRE